MALFQSFEKYFFERSFLNRHEGRIRPETRNPAEAGFLVRYRQDWYSLAG
jgi:hypothetical protein